MVMLVNRSVVELLVLRCFINLAGQVEVGRRVQLILVQILDSGADGVHSTIELLDMHLLEVAFLTRASNASYQFTGGVGDE